MRELVRAVAERELGSARFLDAVRRAAPPSPRPPDRGAGAAYTGVAGGGAREPDGGTPCAA